MTAELKCLDDFENDCAGEVKLRFPLRAGARAFSRCNKHWQARLNRQVELDRKYPDTPHAPAGFDPAYAGEHWDSDY